MNSMSCDNIMSSVYLSLGGNIGNVEEAFLDAISIISKEYDIELIKISSLYETKPWGVENQPDFLNCCVEIKTSKHPEDLLSFLLKVELELGRVRVSRWGGRVIDIDLLFWEGDLKWNSNFLKLPHPYLTERLFVLEPLMELEPDLIINEEKLSYWVQRAKDQSVVRRPNSILTDVVYKLLN